MIPQRIETLQKLLSEATEKVQNIISYMSVLETELLKYKEEYKLAQEATAAIGIKREEAIKVIEEAQTLQERENALNMAHKAFDEEKTALAKEKELLHEKQVYLENKEQKLNDKAERFQRLMNE